MYWEFHGYGPHNQAVRFGDWKAVRKRTADVSQSIPELYNLASDPSEQKDLAAERPELAAKAAAYMNEAHTPSWEPKWNFPSGPTGPKDTAQGK